MDGRYHITPTSNRRKPINTWSPASFHCLIVIPKYSRGERPHRGWETYHIQNFSIYKIEFNTPIKKLYLVNHSKLTLDKMIIKVPIVKD